MYVREYTTNYFQVQLLNLSCDQILLFIPFVQRLVSVQIHWQSNAFVLLLHRFCLPQAASAMGDVKNFLYAWCGKRKITIAYEIRAVGNKNRQKFVCEVSIE